MTIEPQKAQRGGAATELPAKTFYRGFRGWRGWIQHCSAFIRAISAIRGQKILSDGMHAGEQDVEER